MKYTAKCVCRRFRWKSFLKILNYSTLTRHLSWFHSPFLIYRVSRERWDSHLSVSHRFVTSERHTLAHAFWRCDCVGVRSLCFDHNLTFVIHSCQWKCDCCELMIKREWVRGRRWAWAKNDATGVCLTWWTILATNIVWPAQQSRAWTRRGISLSA